MKTVVRRVLNLALWLIFSMMVATGLLMEFRLPPGREGGHGLSVWGLGRHDWGEWHLILGYLFLALIIVHMGLAWPWLKKVAAKGKLLPVVAGLSLGVIIMLVPFLVPVEGAHSSDEAISNHEGEEHFEDRHPQETAQAHRPGQLRGAGNGWGRRRGEP